VHFDFFAQEVLTVLLAGDFNGWDVSSLPMKKDRQGTWKTSVNLQPGRYEYGFWVDTGWQDDPHAQEKIENPFGSHNCIKFVS
jgi:1,4-alpha-glucan branching enzyme